MVRFGKTVKSGRKCKGVVISAIIVFSVVVCDPINCKNGEIHKMLDIQEKMAGTGLMTVAPSESGLAEMLDKLETSDLTDGPSGPDVTETPGGSELFDCTIKSDEENEDAEATEDTIVLKAATHDQPEGEQMDLFPDDLPRTEIVPKMLQGETEWTPANLRKWLANDPPEMEFLFKDIFPAGIVAALCGPGGVGKSTLTLQLAYSLATGMTVFPAFVPLKPRRVMLFLGEDPEFVTWQRIRCIAKVFPMTPAQEDLLVENLRVYPQRAMKLCNTHKGMVCPTPAYEELRREVSKIRPALLILDPKSRWAGTNENSNDDATGFVTLLEDLIKPHGTTLLITHHVSKSGAGSLSATGARGASAFVDALRLVFNMVGPDEGSPSLRDMYTLLDISKSNFTPKLLEPIWLSHFTNAGVLLQVPNEERRMGLLNIAQVLCDWLANNGPINLSAIFDPREERAKKLHEFLRERCGPFKKDLEESILVGHEEGLLTLEKLPTKGRPALTVNARIIPKETVAGTGETLADSEENIAESEVKTAA